jgi:tRNA threonylcarbamoyladenosine dehydratase
VSDYEARFEGVRRLYGAQGAERLRRAHVCAIGLGGVGSWAVEALARCGIGQFTLIDFDDVCVSNMNRQLPALSSTVGQLKVAVMKARVLEINPECQLQAREEFFTKGNADEILQERFDCVLDAIDSVASKCLLIAKAKAAGVPIVTAGGSGGRKDPTQLRVADLGEATHDRLLQRVRKVLRKDHGFQKGKELLFRVRCVYSPEEATLPEGESCEAGEARNCNKYGTVSFVTGAFGLALAGCVVEEVLRGVER